MIERLEDSLNGHFGGLYGEVVTEDCYRLKQLKFVPDLVFDIGANVGIFTRYARSLFPQTFIMALEPHPENCEVFRKFTADIDISLIQGALGRGPLYRCAKACNGAHECYPSAGLGYPEVEMNAGVQSGTQDLEFSSVPVWSLSEVVSECLGCGWVHLLAGLKTLMKIDCEGAENVLWEDERAMQILRRMNYLTIELHYHALHGGVLPQVKMITDQALKSLEETHLCERKGPHFYATRR